MDHQEIIVSFKFICPIEVIQMPHYSYSFENYEKSRHVRSSLRDKSISHKHAREIALAIKGKSIEKAREFLEEVLSKKIAVPYRRYHNEVAHRSCRVGEDGRVKPSKRGRVGRHCGHDGGV